MLQRQAAYFTAIFNLLKTAAFHQLYMDSARQDLCKNDNYDPRTAFKALDSFKHNRVIAYELYSFFDLHRIQSTVQQCQEIIKSLNKSISQLDWQIFQQMTLPRNIVVKNLALTRFNNVKVEVGTYTKLTYVKQHTQHAIALFLEKQLNFCREFLFMRQQFVRQWGGDIYTMLQKIFKEHKKHKRIQFEQFYEIARRYGVLFNKDQFYAIWKRSKNQNEKIQEMGNPVQLQFDQLLVLLLANDFKTKPRYGLQQNIPIQKSLLRPQPSYKVSHWKQHQIWQREQKQKQILKLRQQNQTKNWDMQYRFSYPQLMDVDWQRNQKAKNISQQVDCMSDRELLQAYFKVTQKRTIFRQ